MRTTLHGWGPVVASWKAYLEAHVVRLQIEPRRLVCVRGGLHGGEGWCELLIVAAQTRSPATLVRGRRDFDPMSLTGPGCHALQGVSVVPPRTAALHFGFAGDLRIEMGSEAIVHFIGSALTRGPIVSRNRSAPRTASASPRTIPLQFRRGRRIEGERLVDLDDGRHFHFDDPSAGLDLLDEAPDDEG